MKINTRKNCPVAIGADIVWDKWSILILRNLGLDGAHRFQDFVNALDGISPTTLSSRLKSLQGNGLICREIIDSHPPKTIYTLTDLGREMKPVIHALGQFGSRVSGQSWPPV